MNVIWVRMHSRAYTEPKKEGGKEKFRFFSFFFSSSTAHVCTVRVLNSKQVHTNQVAYALVFFGLKTADKNGPMPTTDPIKLKLRTDPLFT